MSVDGDASMNRARSIALTLLAEHRQPTPEDVESAVTGAIAATAHLGAPVDAEKLRRRINGDVSVFVGDGAVLDDPDADHRPWLDARRADIDWRFWKAYAEHTGRHVPREVVQSLDRITDDVLSRFEDPSRPGPWDTRGMVVGSVQSGKTSNYTGLICKAADAGYNFIVVLAGLHNSLRSQTQARLDEGFLGVDSRLSVTGQPTRRLGVGAGGRLHPSVQTLTSSDERGDFSIQVASRLAARIDSDSRPYLLVVKKNKRILENLINWVTQTNGDADPETGRLLVRGFPLLVVDDEADNASVNTNDPHDEDTDPTAINALIRRLLNSFDRSALVSYTATPFANIFIDGDGADPGHGEDLFPRSFIIQIPPPTNYIGPARVFGISAAEDPEGVGSPGLPVCRLLADNEDWLETGHRRGAVPGTLPVSLEEALRAFVLVCAARAARGQVDVHNSMLVHVTRFVDVQRLVAEQLRDELDSIVDRIAGADPAMIDALQALWQEDFAGNVHDFPEDLRGEPVEWSQVEAQLARASARIRVMEINGTARDALTYSDHPEGVSVVAVGGDKLSRGLTLEGLSVSYYLRASRMYDTLMQMGRWFGYRPGYADLIRIYTTGELVDWYSDITVAAEELGDKFREMARVGSKPTQFALYVRQSPAGLLVTARSKMRSSRTMWLTFSGDVIETIGFPGEAAIERQNINALEGLLRAQTAAGRRVAPDTVRPAHPRWVGVPGEEVATALASWQALPRAQKAQGALLARFIRDRIPHGQLTTWTVVLIDNSSAAVRRSFADVEVGLTVRAQHPGRQVPPSPGEPYTIRRLGDPRHETLDLDAAQREAAERLRDTAFEQAKQRAEENDLDVEAVKRPAIGPYAREVRPESHGLLVIYALDPENTGLDTELHAIPGWLVSFPTISDSPAIRYSIPTRYDAFDEA